MCIDKLPSDHPRMLFGPFKGEPVDTRRIKSVRLIEKNDTGIIVDNFLNWGEYGKIEIGSETAVDMEMLGSISKKNKRHYRRVRGDSEAPIFYHTAILYHLAPPAFFYKKTGPDSYESKGTKVSEIVSAGNAVGPPGIKFSPGNATRRAVVLVLRLISLDDFLFEEDYILRHQACHMPAGFKDRSQIQRILELALEYGNKNQYSVEYKWITGPNCHAWTRDVIDPVVKYKGVLNHIGPIGFSTYLKTRGIFDSNRSKLKNYDINRKDPKYIEIHRRFKARLNSPEYDWIKTYELPQLSGSKRTVFAGLWNILVKGKFNPLRKQTRTLRDEYYREEDLK